MLRPAGNLNGSYAVFGEVIQGEEMLDRMSGTLVDTNDTPLQRIEIVEAKLVRSDSKLAADEGPAGRKSSKPESQKGRIEKFIERVW